jgi:hypothetical protein
MYCSDGSTENLLAATAILLCIRDAISPGEQSFSWRLHLQGACTILRKDEYHLSPTTRDTRRLLSKLAVSLHIRSLLPISRTNGLDKLKDTSNCRRTPAAQALLNIMKEIRSLRLDRIALQAIESNSYGSSNMDRLWLPIKGRCLELIVQINGLIDQSNPCNDWLSALHNLYAYTAVLQIYTAVLQLGSNDAGLRGTVDRVMQYLRSLVPNATARLSVMVILPLFRVGILLQGQQDRRFLKFLLDRIAREQGKANAAAAIAILEELWKRSDIDPDLVVQMELDKLTSGCHSASLVNIADKIPADKGFDLSLW